MRALFVMLVTLLMASTTAMAPPLPPFIPFGDKTEPIHGYRTYCEVRREHDCGENGLVSSVPFDPLVLGTLVSVNARVNRHIHPVIDMLEYGSVEYWALLPLTRHRPQFGDCEEYVLLKRSILRERGFPRSALLITVVIDQNGEGHAVLTVRTDKGDLVLDNLQTEILPWHETPYQFLKISSPTNSLEWYEVEKPSPSSAYVVGK